MDLEVLVNENFYKNVVVPYYKFIDFYYKKNKETTPIHIDTLILIYRLSKDDRIFRYIFDTHKFLLLKIVRNTFNKYKKFLYKEDYYDMMCMIYCEFYRRITKYEMPSRAPFSKYVKLYLKKWLNTYTKLIVNKNNRIVLDCDKEEYDDKSSFKNS